MAIEKIPFRSRVMVFSNNRLLFLIPWERGFAIGKQWCSIGNSGIGDPLTLYHEQTIFGKEIHTLIILMVNVMASNTVDGL